MKNPLLTIGQVAAYARVTVDSVRFYERRELIASASRTSAGYRLYPRQTVQSIAFIKDAQRCGMALEEIRVLLRAAAAPQDPLLVRSAGRLAAEKAADIAARVTLLHVMTETLTSVIAWCAGPAQSRAESACPLHCAGRWTDMTTAADAPARGGNAMIG